MAEGGPALLECTRVFLLLFGQGVDEAEARDLISEAGPLFAEAAFAAAQRGEAEHDARLVAKAGLDSWPWR